MIAKTILGIILLAGTCFNASHCFADGLYIAPSVSNIDAGEANFNLVNLTAGYDFNEYVGVRGSWMVGAETEIVDGVTLELDRMYGGDLVFSLPGDSFSPYAFAGKTYVEVSASYNGYSATADDSYSTYGLGLNYSFNPTAGAFIEVKKIDDAESISAGLKIEF